MSRIDDILNAYKRTSKANFSKKADGICENSYSNNIFVRGIIEFSNHCERDCLYCGIRAGNKNIQRYRMSKEDILKTVREGYAVGLRSFVLQSGEDSHYTPDLLCKIVEEIKTATDFRAAVTLSCGVRSKAVYRMLRRSGADRYLLRFETSDAKLHRYIRKGMPLKARLKALDDLKECGYEVGSGYMVGLPGETEQTRINNALLCYKYKFDMIGIGPFIPHPDTPLAKSKPQSFDLVVRAVSLVRHLLPDANIPATTASGSIEDQGREKLLVAGANVLMPNITPPDFKKHYILYPGKICLDESGFECLECLRGRVSSLNKAISFERGDSRSFLRGFFEQAKKKTARTRQSLRSVS